MTLLLETLRKQMCLKDAGGGGGGSSKEMSKNLVSQSTDNCSSSSSNSSSSSSRGSHGSYCSSPSPSQSPHCPASPQSPHCSGSPPSLPHLLKQPLEPRSDSHEVTILLYFVSHENVLKYDIHLNNYGVCVFVYENMYTFMKFQVPMYYRRV